MDQTLKLKYHEWQKAFKSLNEALARQKSDIVRDSVIKRFEYTYELGWKIVKIFLNQAHGIDVFSPKECFRSLRSLQIFSESETESLLQMVDDRNLIIHTYAEEFSDQLYGRIRKKYVGLFQRLDEVIGGSLK